MQSVEVGPDDNPVKICVQFDTLKTKEQFLEDRDQEIETRDSDLRAKQVKVDQLEIEHTQAIEKAFEEKKQALLKITGMSEEEAKRETLRLLEHQVQHEAAQIIQEAAGRR